MSENHSSTMKLYVVESIQSDNGNTSFCFRGGKKATLSSNHAEWRDYLEFARESFAENYPVAVRLTEANRVVAMESADNDIVKQLIERDKERVEVWFQGHDGIFFLRRDHPEYARLSEVLQRSAREKGRVWFVSALPALDLLDVVPHEPKEKAVRTEGSTSKDETAEVR